MLLRELREDETELLREFLYEAIFIPDGVDPPPREIIEQPELVVYYENFGSGEADMSYERYIWARRTSAAGYSIF